MKILKPALPSKETWADGTTHVQQISVWLKWSLLDVITGTETTLIPLSFSCLLQYIYLCSYFMDWPYVTSVRLLSYFSVMRAGPVFEKAEGQIFDTVILKLKTLFSYFHFSVCQQTSRVKSQRIAEEESTEQRAEETAAHLLIFLHISLKMMCISRFHFSKITVWFLGTHKTAVHVYRFCSDVTVETEGGRLVFIMGKTGSSCFPPPPPPQKKGQGDDRIGIPVKNWRNKIWLKIIL